MSFLLCAICDSVAVVVTTTVPESQLEGTDLMYPDVVIIHRSKRLVVYGTQYEDRIAIAHNSVETTLHAHLTSGCLVVTRVRCPPKPLRQDSNSLSDPHMASQDARITER